MRTSRQWVVACFFGLILSVQSAQGDDQRFAFHGLSYNQAVDMPQVDVLDCLYGEGLGIHTRNEVETGQARRGECVKGGGTMQPGKPANGPDGFEYLDVKTLYPDNAPPKIRGAGRKSDAWYAEHSRIMYERMQAEPVALPTVSEVMEEIKAILNQLDKETQP